MKLAVNGKLSVIQMDHNNRQQPEPPTLPQHPPPISEQYTTEEHIQILQDNVIRLSSLLERYHDFTKEFVFNCGCVRSREESMRIGAQYNELAAEYQMLVKMSGDFASDAHPPPPPPHKIMQMRKPQHPLEDLPPTPPPAQPPPNTAINGMQRIRQIHNESPQLQLVLASNHQPQSNHINHHHDQMSFNNSISPNSKNCIVDAIDYD